MTKNQPENGITVLICTYNGAERLQPTLTALLTQQDTGSIPWEVILVDNASTDSTGETARKIWDTGSIPFLLLNEAKPGRDNALRTGFEHARYEFVCNVDDDTWVCNDYVRKVWDIMTLHPEVAVCGGQGYGEFESSPPVWLKRFESALAIGPQGDEAGYVSDNRAYLYGACAVYRKSLWMMLRNNHFTFFLSGRKGKKLNSGEDFELCQAWKMAGYRLWYEPGITFRHYMPAARLTWSYFRRLFRAFGRSDLVTQQYFNRQGLYGTLKSYVINHYAIYLLYTSYQLVKKLPLYCWQLIVSGEGTKIVLDTERDFSLLIELLCNRKKYLIVKKTVLEAQWFKNT